MTPRSIWSAVAGTGSYLPARVLTNAELAASLDTTDEWIRERTGIRRRHIAAAGETCSDMAFKACQRALDAADLPAIDVELIIVATSTGDYIFPSTACVLQAKLGSTGCAAFDVQSACTGFVSALTIADSMIRSGQVRNALVVGAEAFSRLVDWRDRSTCILFGDGAGAVVLRASSAPGIMTTLLRADGRNCEVLQSPSMLPHGGAAVAPCVKMDGPAVFRGAVRLLTETALALLEESGLALSAVDWIVPHQANRRIIDAVAAGLALDIGRMIVTVDGHGNTAAASIPLALDEAIRDGRLKRGHTVLLQAVGAGFSWGGALLKL